MKFILKYEPSVVKEDIPPLDGTIKKRIKNSIELKLLTNPETFGIPLRKSLKGYRKLRVGDYRVIFLIKDSIITIKAIGHRSEIYKKNIN